WSGATACARPFFHATRPARNAGWPPSPPAPRRRAAHDVRLPGAWEKSRMPPAGGIGIAGRTAGRRRDCEPVGSLGPGPASAPAPSRDQKLWRPVRLARLDRVSISDLAEGGLLMLDEPSFRESVDLMFNRAVRLMDLSPGLEQKIRVCNSTY